MDKILSATNCRTFSGLLKLYCIECTRLEAVRQAQGKCIYEVGTRDRHAGTIINIFAKN